MSDIGSELALNPSKQPTPEVSLPPEIVERVMEKVLDINRYGTAFSVVAPNSTENVLRHGILGMSGNYIRRHRGESRGSRTVIAARHSEIPPDTQQKMIDNWPEYMKEGGPGEGLVFFNIVGRSSDHQGMPLIGESTYFKGGDAVAIVFDLSGYEEDLLGLVNYDQPVHEGTYRAHREHPDSSALAIKRYLPDSQNPTKEDILNALKRLRALNEKGDIKNDDGYGFKVYGRIDPSIFTGIVLKTSKYRQLSEEWIEVEGEITDRQTLQQITNELATKMIAIDGPNPDLLVPIYHHSGDLYWPKYIPYAEIKSQQEAQEVKSS